MNIRLQQLSLAMIESSPEVQNWIEQSLGRFLTKDPAAPSLNNSQALNQYVYSLNNPIILIDPSGLSGMRDGNVLSASISSSDRLHNSYLQPRPSGNSLIFKTIRGLLFEFGVSVVGIAKTGLDRAPILSGVSGLLEFFDAAKELRDPTERFTEIYNKLSSDQKRDVNERITVSSGRSWNQLTPQEKQSQWQDDLFRIPINQLYLHDDYSLLLRHPPPLTSLP